MRIGAALAAVALVSCVLSGCGGGEAPQAAPPAPSTTSSPAAWSREQAGQEYLKIVAPLNAVMAESRTLPQGAPMDTYRPLCKRAVTAADQMMRDLNAGSWPTDARSAVDDLIAESSEVRSWYAACVSAQSMNDMAAVPVPHAKAGAVVRVKLGLPPADVATASPSASGTASA